MAQEKKKNQVNIELPEDIAEGIYANMAIIAHSNSEFVLDFIRMVPNLLLKLRYCYNVLA